MSASLIKTIDDVLYLKNFKTSLISLNIINVLSITVADFWSWHCLYPNIWVGRWGGLCLPYKYCIHLDRYAISNLMSLT
jgi:hypothetical protein